MEATRADYDIIILGAGPAGLTAGIYSLRRGLRVLVLESKFPGGRITEDPQVENYPGFIEPISGEELAKRIVAQFERFGGRINLGEEPLSLLLRDEVKTVVTRRGRYTAKAAIIAIGAQRRTLSIAGEKEFLGRGVSYCALCDGPIFRGEEVAVVGSEDEAFEDGLFLTDVASKVLLISKEEPQASSILIRKFEEKGNTEILRGCEVTAISGDKFVNLLRVNRSDTGEIMELHVKAVFISVGVVPTTEMIKKAGVEMDDRGFIKVDRRQMTNLRGVFAAGDCTGGGMQISTAVGEGAMAAISSFKVMK